MTANQVRELRASLGETRQQFAKRFDVTPKAVERWEYKAPPQSGPALMLLASLTPPQIAPNPKQSPKDSP